MKATLEFNLPDDQAEFDIACAAVAYRCILGDVMEQTRQWLKYGHNFATPDDVLTGVRNMIYSQLDERHIPWE